jgi:hypothetical protein
MKSGWSLSALTGAVAACMVMLPALAPAGGGDDTKPNGKGARTLLNPGNGYANGQAKAKPGGTNGIGYHGGPVLLGAINVYYIWYGNWSGDNTPNLILTNLVNSIGGSPYFNINTTYYDGAGNHVTGLVHYVTSTNDNYSLGTTLSDANIQTIVATALSNKTLPYDPNGAYFVLTSQDVAESSGFCTQYCGWHTYGTIAGTNIKYAFVGNAARCPSACEAQTTSPNGNAGADAMASVIAHELEEMVTDPNLNAWYDTRGAENADKCAWTFGTTSPAANGSKYNISLNSYQYLIQQNWVNASGGYCALQYP